MADADLKAKWAAITDPVECLEQLSEHSMYLGSDPYYRDMNDALWEMAIRVINISKKPAKFRSIRGSSK
jgi:hypothetical protein